MVAFAAAVSVRKYEISKKEPILGVLSILQDEIRESPLYGNLFLPLRCPQGYEIREAGTWPDL